MKPKPSSHLQATTTSGHALRLHVWLEGISPMIWRRLLVPANSSLGDLHETLQIAFGWDDDHLHRFRVHARDIGLYRPGGLWFDADAHAVSIDSLALRRNEKFLYEYNLHVPWRHVIRVEEILLPPTPLPYPKCVGAQGQAPPEECGSPGDFMDYQDHHSELWLYGRLAKIAERFLKDNVRPRGGEADDVRYWLEFMRPDRKKINDRLARQRSGEVAIEEAKQGAPA